MRNRGTERQVRSALADLNFQLTPLDTDLAVLIGLLSPLTANSGLSLGDRACLALARRLGGPALTSDRRWAEIADTVGVKVELIR
jgi:PIN domain nuclease of toxin-antitoxin system